MTYERRVVTHTDDPAVVPGTSTNQVVERTDVSPSGGEMLRRIVTLVFGIIQAFIVLRMILLLLDAREGNALVSFILNTSQIFVGPFEGMLRTDALAAGGSVFDVAALLALVGWTILEALILAAVGVFRREPA